MVTPENAMKFKPLQPERGRYDFDDADAIVNFAGANGMQVRGHTLVWHHDLPFWITGVKRSRDELMGILREHIHTVVGRYRGRVIAWDVVNEALADDGRSLRDSVWLRGIGPDYIELAFRWAHEADPQARLFYNDFGSEGMNQKSDAVYRLVRRLQERGAPIHGVGLQAHLSVKRGVDFDALVANMGRLAALGLAVHITEMDVRIPAPVTEEKLAAQAGVYRRVLEACLSAPNCGAFVMWGFTDRYSWIPKSYPGTGAPLILDDSYGAKPAYYGLRDVLTRATPNSSSGIPTEQVHCDSYMYFPCCDCC
jgi:endo-1,4-beta-xylanase